MPNSADALLQQLLAEHATRMSQFHEDIGKLHSRIDQLSTASEQSSADLRVRLEQIAKDQTETCKALAKLEDGFSKLLGGPEGQAEVLSQVRKWKDYRKTVRHYLLKLGVTALIGLGTVISANFSTIWKWLAEAYGLRHTPPTP